MQCPSHRRIKAFCRRLLAAVKPKKLAFVVAMRKLLTILNTLIKRDELWSDPVMHNQKNERPHDCEHSLLMSH